VANEIPSGTAAEDLPVGLPAGLVTVCEIGLEPRVIAVVALVGHAHAHLAIICAGPVAVFVVFTLVAFDVRGAGAA